MIAATTASLIEDCQIVAYKGTAQDAILEELLRNAESLGVNAILNACSDSAFDLDTLFDGTAVLMQPMHPRAGSHGGAVEMEEGV